MEAPLPPSDVELPAYDVHDDDGTVKTARQMLTSAGVFLAIGLILEMTATFWAFGQAVSTGAVRGYIECNQWEISNRLHVSSVVQEMCEFLQPENYSYYSSSDLFSCDNPTDARTGGDSFDLLCNCPGKITIQTPCSWIPRSELIKYPSTDRVCIAEAVRVDDDGTLNDLAASNVACWARNPSGTEYLTVTALVVALSSQLVEALVGYKYLKDAQRRTAMMGAASVFEALGVFVVSCVLAALPHFFNELDTLQHRVLFGSLFTAVASAIIGALAEITAQCSGCAAARLPYLGAIGNALVWLGAAMLEVVVTSYLVWKASKNEPWGVLVDAIAGLFVVEVLALVAMWIARGLWTRAKILMSLKGRRVHERPGVV